MASKKSTSRSTSRSRSTSSRTRTQSASPTVKTPPESAIASENPNPSAPAAAAAAANEPRTSEELAQASKESLKDVSRDALDGNDASAVVTAALAEPVWTPESEIRDPYANPVAKKTFESTPHLNEGSGTSENAPDSRDKEAARG